MFPPLLFFLVRQSKRMAISADCLWVVVRFIGVTARTNIPLGHLPFVGNMASRAVGGGVCRLKMQFRAVRMT